MDDQLQKAQVKPWDRMEGEPDMWYHRFFTYYRPLPVKGRSIAAAHAAGKADESINTVSKSGSGMPKHWNGIAKRWDWKARAVAWDDYMRNMILNAEMEDMSRMLVRHLAAARLLFDKSIAYLSTHEIGDSKTAIRALAMAISEERKVKGLPDYLVRIYEMSDEDLRGSYETVVEVFSRLGGGDEQAGDRLSPDLEIPSEETSEDTDSEY